MPIPNASPPKDIMLIVRSNRYIKTKVVIMERGIETDIIRVVGKFLRKMNSTKTASTPPIRAICQTLLIESSMKSAGE